MGVVLTARVGRGLQGATEGLKGICTSIEALGANQVTTYGNIMQIESNSNTEGQLFYDDVL
jgi:hypothetical protein